MKQMIPLILMPAMLLTGCAIGAIPDEEALTIEPKPEMAEITPDPWHSIAEQEQKKPQVELTREPDMDEPPAACISGEELNEAPDTSGFIELALEPAATYIAGQAEADSQVEAAAPASVQEQEIIAGEASQSAPVSLKSSVAWVPAPKQQAATPQPVQTLGFVIQAPGEPKWPHITCPPEPTPTPDIPAPTEQPEQPIPIPTAAPVEPDPTPAPTPEPKPVETPPAVPEPTPTPAGGYAICSCGATLQPDELVAHMKQHAMNGESHSYVAY